jgi:GNAT superfamily N-acetyltransferase
MTAFSVRTAVAGEERVIVCLLQELAEYEKIADRFKLTEAAAARDFLGPQARCSCELALIGADPIGVMTWYPIYSSFAAERGIFLEDLYLRTEYRGRGFGNAMFAHLARRAVAEGAHYIDWFVLDWNKPSIAFYEHAGAEPVHGWLSYRLSGEALARLADA